MKKQLCCLHLTTLSMTIVLLWSVFCLCSSLCHAWSPSFRFLGSHLSEKTVISIAKRNLLPISFLHSWSLKSIDSNSNIDSGGNPVDSSSIIAQPFGRQDYWESFYRNQQDDFSWYSTWNDIKPFLLEWIVTAPDPSSLDAATSKDDDCCYNILLPGIGSDVSLVENLCCAGFHNLYAFDYAQESIDYCRQRIQKNKNMTTTTIDFRTADARNLTCYDKKNNELLLPSQHSDEQPFYFDVVIDKGTLDAIYLAGTTTEERIHNLKLAICEMQRLLRPGTGIFWSLSGICTQQLINNVCWKDWHVCVDSSSELYTTRDGYTSNNLDGTLLVWRKPAEAAAAAVSKINS